MEKTVQSNRDLRRRQRNSANQMRCLIDERAELQAALQEEQRMTTVLRQRLGLAVKENEDLQTCSVSSYLYLKINFCSLECFNKTHINDLNNT